MSLSSTDIARIANLARLALEPTESERMLTQINQFFDIVEQMRAVDTRGIEPLSHPVATMDVALRLLRRHPVVLIADQHANLGPADIGIEELMAAPGIGRQHRTRPEIPAVHGLAEASRRSSQHCRATPAVALQADARRSRRDAVPR